MESYQEASVPEAEKVEEFIPGLRSHDPSPEGITSQHKDFGHPHQPLGADLGADGSSKQQLSCSTVFRLSLSSVASFLSFSQALHSSALQRTPASSAVSFSHTERTEGKRNPIKKGIGVGEGEGELFVHP